MGKLSPSIRLNNGIEIPLVGFGTATAHNEFCELAISTALDVGYRHFDTAAFYGNEEAIGRALRKKFLSSEIRREDVFITTKLWNTDHQVEHVREGCEKSLQRLGLSCIDLYLVHWPVSLEYCEGAFPPVDAQDQKFDFTPLENTWHEMEKLVDDGLTKSIGISNFNRSQIERILSICRIKPAMLQVEVSVNHLNRKVVEFAKSVGIAVTAYASLGSLALIPAGPTPLTEPNVLQIAEGHNKTPAQILLRHLFQLEICTIAKSSNPERIKSNFEIFDFELSTDEMEVLNTMDKNMRLFNADFWKSHPEYPFNDEY